MAAEAMVDSRKLSAVVVTGAEAGEDKKEVAEAAEFGDKVCT